MNDELVRVQIQAECKRCNLEYKYFSYLCRLHSVKHVMGIPDRTDYWHEYKFFEDRDDLKTLRDLIALHLTDVQVYYFGAMRQKYLIGKTVLGYYIVIQSATISTD